MAAALRAVGIALAGSLALPGFSFAAEKPAKPSAAIPLATLSHPDPVNFEKELLPALSSSCLACHNKTKAKAGLVLETPADIRRGGDDGAVVKPGKGSESLLLKAASHAPDVESIMPPPNNKVAAADLTPAQLALMKLWIDQGAAGEVRGTLAPLKWQAMPAALDPILAVTVSGDGHFAVCGRSNRIDVYDLSAGKLAAHLLDPQLTSAGADAAHRDMVESLAISPDGTLLASGSFREVKLWRKSSAGEKHLLGEKPAVAVAASADGKWIATGAEDGSINLWNAADLKPAGELAGHSARIAGLQFSADGSRLLSCGKDKSIRVWDVARHLTFSQVEAADEVRCVAWLGARTIAAGGTNGSVTAYTLPSAADGKMTVVKTFTAGKTPVAALAGIPGDEAHFLLGLENGEVHRASIGSGTVRPLLRHGAALTSMAILADGKRVATCGADHVARIWKLEDSKMIAELKGDPAIASSIASGDRALALAKSEVTFRTARLELAGRLVKSSADRAQKAREALPVSEKALTDAQKAYDSANAASASAEQAMKARKQAIADALVKAEAEQQNAKAARAIATEQSQKARELLAAAERDLATAQRAMEAARAARDAAQAREKDEAKKAAAVKEFEKCTEQLATAKTARATAAEESQKAKDAVASAEKNVAAAQRAFGIARAAKDASENPRDEKKESAAKDLAKAADELKKSQNARSAAEDEIKLSARGVEESAERVALAKSAMEAAQSRVKIREKEAAEMRQALSNAAKPVRALAVSPDGGLIATAGDDGVVHTWSSATGSAGESCGSENAPVAAIAFAGRDRFVVCPTSGPPAVVKPSTSWKLERTIGASDGPFSDRVTSLDFSPDGHTLAAAGGVPSRSGEIRLFDVASGALKKSFDDVHSDTILCVRYSPDGSHLASSGADRIVRVLDLNSGKVRLALEGHAGHALSVAWSHDGHTLASAGSDNSVRFWDAESGERGKVIAGFDKEVTGVCYVGDENNVVASSGDAKVRLIRSTGGDGGGRTYSGPTDFMNSVSASADGAVIVAGGQDGILRAWNAATGAPTATFAPAMK